MVARGATIHFPALWDQRPHSHHTHRSPVCTSTTGPARTAPIRCTRRYAVACRTARTRTTRRATAAVRRWAARLWSTRVSGIPRALCCRTDWATAVRTTAPGHPHRSALILPRSTNPWIPGLSVKPDAVVLWHNAAAHRAQQPVRRKPYRRNSSERKFSDVPALASGRAAGLWHDAAQRTAPHHHLPELVSST